MAKFVLTAQIQLQAPNNASQVVQQINKQLQGVSIPVSVKAAGAATKQINQITAATQRASSAADAMGRSFGLAIKRFAAFTVASRAVSLFTNSLAAAIDDAIEFQREIVRISQVTGKSVRELAGLKKTISDLAGGLGISSKELLSTATVLSQAGIGAKDLNVALEALAKTSLAATFDSMEQTAEGAIAILAQFGQGVGALEVQLSSVNAVSAAFAVESEDLISAVRRFGGVFKTSGGSLEELLALFTSVRATTRESAESISTGLRTIFTRIQRPKTIEFLRQFGVELTDLNGKFVGPFEAAKRLSEAFGNLPQGDASFIRVAEELGGFRQIGKVIPLLQQFAIAQDALTIATEGSNSLTTDAATAQQALAVQITKVKEEFYSLVRNVADSDSFQIFARTALELASALIKVADSLKPLIPLIGTFLAFNFAKGIGTFASGAGAAIRGLGTLGKSNGGRILGFARGGSVPGVGNQDTVPAMLTPGEFVIRKSSVNKIGADKLAAMNENRFSEGTLPGGIRKRAAGAEGSRLNAKSPKENPFKSTKKNIVEFQPIPNKIGLFFMNPDSSKKRKSTGTSKDLEFKLTSIDLRNAIGIPPDVGRPPKKGSELPAVLKGGEYSLFYPNLKDMKQSLGDQIRPRVAEGLGNTVRDIVKDLKSTGAVNIPPVIDGDETALDFARQQISNDQGALNTTSGYIFEGIISALTGAKVGTGHSATKRGGTGQSNFDFSTAEIQKNRKQLAGLFGNSTNIANLAKADAKATYTSQYLNAKKDGSVPRKTINDINEGNLSGVEMLTAKSRKLVKKASGGSIYGSRVARFAEGGSAGTDTVPALLTPGEFVVNKSSAQRIGYGNLNRMNKQGVARFAKGGSVGGGWARYNDGSTGNGVPDPKVIKKIEERQAYLKSSEDQLTGDIKVKRVNKKNLIADQEKQSSALDSVSQKIKAAPAGQSPELEKEQNELIIALKKTTDDLKEESDSLTSSALAREKVRTELLKNSMLIKELNGETAPPRADDRSNSDYYGEDPTRRIQKRQAAEASMVGQEPVDQKSSDTLPPKRKEEFTNEQLEEQGKDITARGREMRLAAEQKALDSIVIEPSNNPVTQRKTIPQAASTISDLEKQKGELEGLKSLSEDRIISSRSNLDALKSQINEQDSAKKVLDEKQQTAQATDTSDKKGVNGPLTKQEFIDNRKALDEQVRVLRGLEKEQEALKKQTQETKTALYEEIQSLDRATSTRDRVTKELEANAQAIKTANGKSSNSSQITQPVTPKQATPTQSRAKAAGKKQSTVNLPAATAAWAFPTQTTQQATPTQSTRKAAGKKKSKVNLAAATSAWAFPQTTQPVVTTGNTPPGGGGNRPPGGGGNRPPGGGGNPPKGPITPQTNPVKSPDLKGSGEGGILGKGTGVDLIAFTSAVAFAQTAIQNFGDKSAKAGDIQANTTIITEKLVGVATVLGAVFIGLIKPLKDYAQAQADAKKEQEKLVADAQKSVDNEGRKSRNIDKQVKKQEANLATAKGTGDQAVVAAAQSKLNRAKNARKGAVVSGEKAREGLTEAKKEQTRVEKKGKTFGVSMGGAASAAAAPLAIAAAVVAVGSAIASGFEDYFNRQKEILQSQDNLAGSVEAAGSASIAASVGSLFTLSGIMQAIFSPENFVKNMREAQKNAQFSTAQEFTASRSQAAFEKIKEGKAGQGAEQKAAVFGTVDAFKLSRVQAAGLTGAAGEKANKEVDAGSRKFITDLDQAGGSIEALYYSAEQLGGANGELKDSLLKQVKVIEANRNAQLALNKATFDSLKLTSAFGAAAEASQRLVAGLETGVNSLDLYSKQLEEASGKVGVDASGAIDQLEKGLLEAAGGSPSLRASITNQANVARATNEFSLSAGKTTGNLKLSGSDEDAKSQIKNSLLDIIPKDADAETTQKLTDIIIANVSGIVGDPRQANISKVIQEISSQSSALASGFAESGKILAAHNSTMIGLYQKREQLEQKASEAANQAIETQLEAAKIFEEFGGSKLTSQQQLGARVSQFNNVGGLGGLGAQLSTGNAGDIRKVANEIGKTFNDQTDKVITSTLARGQAGGAGVGPFAGPSGFSDDKRQEAENANKALVQFTKQRLDLLKEELSIAEKKNQAEKDSLESLISGDIEGFLEKQAAAGAGAALASGSSALTGLFSGAALGAGFKTLDGQGLSDDKTRRAEDLTLQRFGVQSTGALSGTTTEEQAIKSQGRELAGVLGELSQQEAQFAQGEFSINTATIVAAQVSFDRELKTVDTQNTQGLYRGGPVYANRGMFVPRGTDTVPAMLTPGEFVVNRSSVQRGNNLQILKAMNNGGGASAPGAMSGGGKARYYNVGGAVDGVSSTFSAAIPQLTTIFNNFAATVDKLIGSKFQVALDTTNINVNFNGASFLETMKEDIKQELLTEVGKQISQFKTNTSGDLKKTNSVLG
jgi:TP901 family phage tail tape measure protein